MTDPTYIQLMQKAEAATNRKEAKQLINLATNTMTKKETTSSCVRCSCTMDQLNEYLILQEQKLANAQAHARTAEALIELIQQKKKELSE